MSDFLVQLFDGQVDPYEKQALGTAIPIAVAIIVSGFLARRIKTPARPENDPYEDTEFGENGVPKSKNDP